MSLWVRTTGGRPLGVPQTCTGLRCSMCIRNAIVGCPLVRSVLASVPEREDLTDITLKVQQLWPCVQHSQLQLTPLN